MCENSDIDITKYEKEKNICENLAYIKNYRIYSLK